MTQDRISETEAAKRLGISRATLANYIKQHKGPAHYKVGKVRTYDPADLAAWTMAQRVPGSGETVLPHRTAERSAIMSLIDIMVEMVAAVSSDPEFITMTRGVLADHARSLGYAPEWAG